VGYTFSDCTHSWLNQALDILEAKGEVVWTEVLNLFVRGTLLEIYKRSPPDQGLSPLERASAKD